MKRKQIKTLYDITIGQYQKIVAIENISNRQLISIIYDIPYEVTADIPEKQINQSITYKPSTRTETRIYKTICGFRF